MEERIGLLAEHLQVGFLEDVEDNLLAYRVELSAWLNREEMHLAQQAKQGWNERGEASADLFRIMSRKNHKVVKEMRISDDIWLKTSEEVHMGAVGYFQHFLASHHSLSLPDLSLLVDKVIQNEDNVTLVELPSIQEIKEVLFSIPTDSSPTLMVLDRNFIKLVGILFVKMW